MDGKVHFGIDAMLILIRTTSTAIPQVLPTASPPSTTPPAVSNATPSKIAPCRLPPDIP